MLDIGCGPGLADVLPARARRRRRRHRLQPAIRELAPPEVRERIIVAPVDRAAGVARGLRPRHLPRGHGAPDRGPGAQDGAADLRASLALRLRDDALPPRARRACSTSRRSSRSTRRTSRCSTRSCCARCSCSRASVAAPTSRSAWTGAARTACSSTSAPRPRTHDARCHGRSGERGDAAPRLAAVVTHHRNPYRVRRRALQPGARRAPRRTAARRSTTRSTAGGARCCRSRSRELAEAEAERAAPRWSTRPPRARRACSCTTGCGSDARAAAASPRPRACCCGNDEILARRRARVGARAPRRCGRRG